MNQIKRLFQLILLIFMVTLVACTPSADLNIPISPTEEFSMRNSFGDGYVLMFQLTMLKTQAMKKLLIS